MMLEPELLYVRGATRCENRQISGKDRGFRKFRPRWYPIIAIRAARSVITV